MTALAPPVLIGVRQVRLSRLLLWLSCTAALLAAAGNIAGLLAGGRVYGKETVALADASAAQDIVNLLVVAPLMVTLAVWASRGSMRAYLCWLGCAAFTVYNYAIYAFSIHFGPLFLLWVAVFGLSVFALACGLATLDTGAVRARFAGRPQPLAAWVLIAVATLFVLLWLSDILPALLAGNPSPSAVENNVPTNPVHVLDLAVFLPAAFMCGALLLRRHPIGYATAAGQLTWLALTCLPILVIPFVSNARGHAAGWAVMAPIGILFIALLGVLFRLLQRLTGDDTADSDAAR